LSSVAVGLAGIWTGELNFSLFSAIILTCALLSYGAPEVKAGPRTWRIFRSALVDVRQGLAGLDARSRDILEQRWLAEEKTGLKELGEKYGISAERLRQLESQAPGRLTRTLQADAA